MIAIRLMLRRLRRDENGATAIEYGLIVALIAVFCVSAFSIMGGGSNGMWTNINIAVSDALQPPSPTP